jgi:hypothetical protein
MRLYAGRWSTDGSTQYADAAMLEPENVGVNWRVDGYGVNRIEVTVRARNQMDQYDRYKNHLGQRLALYGSDCYRPISGFITDVEYAGAGRVTYTAKGPGAARMEDELDTTVYTSATTIDAAIKYILTQFVSVSSSDQSNIDSNSTTLGGWQPDTPQGSYPARIIAELLDKSDSAGNIWDFWLQDAPFSGVSLGDYVPYYKARSATAAADWIVYRRDLSRLQLARDINDLRTNVSVYYGTITGTHTGANNSSTLIDSTRNFGFAGVLPGDRVSNLTDGSRSIASSVSQTSPTTLILRPITGGTDNDFDTSDAYSIELQEPQYAQSDSVTPIYWTRECAENQSKMTFTQAGQYADILKNTEPRQVQSFTVGAPWIRDGSGARWPLWEVIAQGGGYIRVADLYPAAALFSTSADKLTTFRITGLDYDYANNQLSVTVQDPSLRLDARLRRAGILNSEQIQRYTGGFELFQGPRMQDAAR